jgi:hypothetical protein
MAVSHGKSPLNAGGGPDKGPDIVTGSEGTLLRVREVERCALTGSHTLSIPGKIAGRISNTETPTHESMGGGGINELMVRERHEKAE